MSNQVAEVAHWIWIIFCICLIASALFIAYLEIGARLVKFNQRRKDNKIFKVAEEARNDFS